MRRRSKRLTSVVTSATVAAAFACTPVSAPPATVDAPASATLPWLSATRGELPGIFDAHGRQVVLRGVNLNHLGDYFSSDPALPTTATLDDDDWEALAAQGVNVVRLVTSWSAWEPTRGVVDEAYLGRVKDAVGAAGAHGIHVVIDMHQDAWSKFVFTPRSEVCPAGTRAQIGWDGAPEWATFTDGEPTCTPGRREESPAVIRAWDGFYGNRDGVRTELSKLWARIATEFADDATVAGFDLLNEPGIGTVLDGTLVGLTAFYREAIGQIRAAERAVDARGHMIFFEPTVTGAWPAYDLSDDTDLVFAPHNYGESIGPSFVGLMDLEFGALSLLASIYRTPIWIGEYGFWGDDVPPRMDRFAALDDRTIGNGGSGGTWWQWEQECGDPHDVSGAYPPDTEWVQRQLTTCGRHGGSLHCTDRPYPRAVPGRLGAVVAACRGHLEVSGSTAVPARADLWFPGTHDSVPTVGGTGVDTVAPEAVDGGWQIAVRVHGEYRILVDA